MRSASLLALVSIVSLASQARAQQASYGQYLIVLDDSGSMNAADPRRLVVMRGLALTGALPVQRRLHRAHDTTHAIPTHPSPIPPAERAPIAALARRRADRDAKVLLAWALLPGNVSPTVRLTAEGAVLQVTREGAPQIVDLSGNAIRTVTGDSGSALALSWGEDAPPAEDADEQTDEGEAERSSRLGTAEAQLRSTP